MSVANFISSIERQEAAKAIYFKNLGIAKDKLQKIVESFSDMTDKDVILWSDVSNVAHINTALDAIIATLVLGGDLHG